MVNELAKSEAPAQEDAASGAQTPKKYQDILVSVEYGNVYKIVLNRPSKLNAITFKVHWSLISGLFECLFEISHF